MKALIAATCVALLAAIGYFFYGEYADAQAREAERLKSIKFAIEADCRRIFEQVDAFNAGARLPKRGVDEFESAMSNCNQFAR